MPVVLGEGGHQGHGGIDAGLAEEDEAFSQPFAGEADFEHQPAGQLRVAAQGADLDSDDAIVLRHVGQLGEKAFDRVCIDFADQRNLRTGETGRVSGCGILRLSRAICLLSE